MQQMPATRRRRIRRAMSTQPEQPPWSSNIDRFRDLGPDRVDPNCSDRERGSLDSHDIVAEDNCGQDSARQARRRSFVPEGASAVLASGVERIRPCPLARVGSWRSASRLDVPRWGRAIVASRWSNLTERTHPASCKLPKRQSAAIIDCGVTELHDRFRDVPVGSAEWLQS